MAAQPNPQTLNLPQNPKRQTINPEPFNRGLRSVGWLASGKWTAVARCFEGLKFGCFRLHSLKKGLQSKGWLRG